MTIEVAASLDAWVDEFAREPGWAERIPWDRLRNRALSLREKQVLREFYGSSYQTDSNYVARHPWHLDIASFRHTLAAAVFGEKLGRVLDAGCASGEIVAAFRRAGVDCHGFDLCPDLHDVVYPEVRPYVRMGRMDAIPYSRADGFTTLVSYDVIEHVPIDCLERLPDELERLGIRNIACVIAADTISPGHITIQGLDEYRALFGRAGFRLMTEFTEVLRRVPAPCGWNEAEALTVWADYEQSGRPRNGWNAVPGHLFFTRDAPPPDSSELDSP